MSERSVRLESVRWGVGKGVAAFGNCATEQPGGEGRSGREWDLTDHQRTLPLTRSAMGGAWGCWAERPLISEDHSGGM